MYAPNEVSVYHKGVLVDIGRADDSHETADVAHVIADKHGLQHFAYKVQFLDSHLNPRPDHSWRFHGEDGYWDKPQNS